jgi:hypothetical protein
MHLRALKLLKIITLARRRRNLALAAFRPARWSQIPYLRPPIQCHPVIPLSPLQVQQPQATEVSLPAALPLQVYHHTISHLQVQAVRRLQSPQGPQLLSSQLLSQRVLDRKPPPPKENLLLQMFPLSRFIAFQQPRPKTRAQSAAAAILSPLRLPDCPHHLLMGN